MRILGKRFLRAGEEEEEAYGEEEEPKVLSWELLSICTSFRLKPELPLWLETPQSKEESSEDDAIDYGSNGYTSEPWTDFDNLYNQFESSMYP
ncbi:hypothetical protein L1987_33671 [Smallanthus sonchifolius]|uniref:Uncharacterized protein n=1 Tax=Smallanthus sonchifolius TaxID=185202 RepID=A0ACB9HSD3_9ASTR|nr:hypothetical protein L1987_33671 [Smallanthus sonchifolius]